MIKNLISTTDLVVQMSKLTGNDISDEKWIEVVINHAKFMKRDLEVGMFIPCDEEGRIEISLISGSIVIHQPNGTGHGIVKKVEDLCGYDFKLTKTAQKRNL